MRFVFFWGDQNYIVCVKGILNLPEVEFVCGAGAEVLCVVEADKTFGAVGARQG